jgi:hypothetical protein
MTHKMPHSVSDTVGAEWDHSEISTNLFISWWFPTKVVLHIYYVHAIKMYKFWKFQEAI